MGWSDIISGAVELGKGAAEVKNAWDGNDSEETAYLRGQLAGIQATQDSQRAADTIKIGDFEISTSSMLWIFGGTLGLLAVGLGIKKLM